MGNGSARPASLAAALLLLLAAGGCRPADDARVLPEPGEPLDAEQAEVVDAVQRFFTAMASRDFAAYEASVVADAMTYSQRLDAAGGAPVQRRTHGEILESMRAAPQRFDERLWNPVVRVDDPVALVWTPYDFYIEGDFSHCGIDSFELFRFDGTWRITNASWTAESEGCEPGPAARDDDEAESSVVLGVVFRMLSSLAAGDFDGYASFLAHDGTTLRALDGQSVRRLTNDAYAAELARDGVALEMRVRDSATFVHGPLAAVWLEYDVHVDDEPVRCGTSAIQLFRIDGEWSVTSASAAERTEGCGNGFA
jgi:hypothetical protein